MGIDISKLHERVKQVDLVGLVDVTKASAGEDKQEIVIVNLLRLKGAFKNDQKEVFKMIIGVDSLEERPNDLRFLVPVIEECEANSVDLTIYMDANSKLYFGAHKWDPESKRVSFTHTVVVPPDAADFPDAPLLQRMLRNMYEGLLFHDLKRMGWNIGEDEMLSDDEKKTKASRLYAMVTMLTGPRATEDGSV